jgi:hypothetical protein
VPCVVHGRCRPAGRTLSRTISPTSLFLFVASSFLQPSLTRPYPATCCASVTQLRAKHHPRHQHSIPRLTTETGCSKRRCCPWPPPCPPAGLSRLASLTNTCLTRPQQNPTNLPKHLKPRYPIQEVCSPQSHRGPGQTRPPTLLIRHMPAVTVRQLEWGQERVRRTGPTSKTTVSRRCRRRRRQSPVPRPLGARDSSKTNGSQRANCMLAMATADTMAAGPMSPFSSSRPTRHSCRAPGWDWLFTNRIGPSSEYTGGLVRRWPPQSSPHLQSPSNWRS